jgi:hypothetical protein
MHRGGQSDFRGLYRKSASRDPVIQRLRCRPAADARDLPSQDICWLRSCGETNMQQEEVFSSPIPEPLSKEKIVLKALIHFFLWPALFAISRLCGCQKLALTYPPMARPALAG